MRKVRLLCLILVSMMLIFCIGCANNGEGTTKSETPNTTTAGSTSDNTTTESKSESTPKVLTMYINDAGASIEYWGKDAISTEIIKATGITLKLSKPTASDDQQLQMMIASNEMTDMYVIGNAHSPINYQLEVPTLSADIGALIDKYVPEFRAYLTDQWFDITKSADGINYSFSNCIYTDQIFKDGRYAIVGPWNPATLVQDKLYADLGSPDVSTPDGLMNTLVRVKNEIPNVVPIFFNHDISNFDFQGVPGGIGLIFAMYGVDKYYLNNDTYYANYKQPEFLDALIYLNKMYQNGLINEQTFALSEEECDTIREQGQFFYWTAGVSEGGYKPAGNPEVSYKYVPYFDTAAIYHMSGSGWMTWYINANIPEESKKAATEFCAYMMGKEGNIYTQWGIEGVDWEYGSDGRPVRTDAYDKHRAEDWSEYTKKSGLGFYNWGINYWDHFLVANTVEKNGIQREAYQMYKDYSGATSYYYRFEPMSSTDEGVGFQRVKDLFVQSFPKMVMAANASEVEAIYNDFVKSGDENGMLQVETYWNKRWADTKYIFD